MTTITNYERILRGDFIDNPELSDLPSLNFDDLIGIIAMVDDVPCRCTSIECYQCDWKYCDCNLATEDWLNEKRKEL